MKEDASTPKTALPNTFTNMACTLLNFDLIFMNANISFKQIF